MNRSFRHSCTMCGKCCNGAPLMTIAEGLHLQDIFIVGVHYNTKCIPFVNDEEALQSWYISGGISLSIEQKQKLADAMRLEYEDKWVKVPTEQISFDVYLHAFAFDAGFSRRKCPALDDNRCTIYDKRPLICKVIPLDSAYPEFFQYEILDSFKNKINESENGKCEFGKKGALIFKDGTIVDNNYRNVWLAFKEKRDVSNSIAADYISHWLKMTKGSLEEYAAVSLSGEYLTSDYLPALTFLIQKEMIKREDAYMFLQNQIDLIEEELFEFNHLLFDQQDEVMKRLRSYQKAYEESLKVNNQL